MGENPTTIPTTDPETGEVWYPKTASLVSELRDLLLSRRKVQVQATVWDKMKESEQREEIEWANSQAFMVVSKVVELVAERGLTCANVEVSKFAVDVEKNIVTITSSGRASDDMLVDLAHAKGKIGRLAIVDARPFDEKKTKAEKPQPDQPEMELDKEEGEMEEPEDLHASGDENGKSDDETSDAGDNSGDQDDFEAQTGIPSSDNEEAGTHKDDGSENVGDNPTSMGRLARIEGALMKHNPFEKGSDDFEEWKMAWKAASDEEPKPEETETPEPTSTEDAGAEPEDPETYDEEIYSQGQKAALGGSGPDENPFDGGTDGFVSWEAGRADAQGEIDEVVASGRKAAEDGKGRDENPFKKTSDANPLWDRGWVGAQSEPPEEEALQAPDEPPQDDEQLKSDAFGLGKANARDGMSIEQNPYNPETDGLKHKFWHQGFESVAGS